MIRTKHGFLLDFRMKFFILRESMKIRLNLKLHRKEFQNFQEEKINEIEKRNICSKERVFIHFLKSYLNNFIFKSNLLEVRLPSH